MTKNNLVTGHFWAAAIVSFGCSCNYRCQVPTKHRNGLTTRKQLTVSKCLRSLRYTPTAKCMKYDLTKYDYTIKGYTCVLNWLFPSLVLSVTYVFAKNIRVENRLQQNNWSNWQDPLLPVILWIWIPKLRKRKLCYS